MDSVSKNWYAIFVLTGEEDNVKERLQYRFGDKYRITVPKRKLRERKDGSWRDIIRVMFPGYILINGTFDVEEYNKFKNVPGLIKLLCSGYEPIRIPQVEIDIISRLVVNDDTIDFSRIFIENGKVTVVDGPLLSMEGQILSVDKRKGRAKVRLQFLGEERTVELGVSVLRPVE